MQPPRPAQPAIAARRVRNAFAPLRSVARLPVLVCQLVDDHYSIPLAPT